jgi:hypothetical protein
MSVFQQLCTFLNHAVPLDLKKCMERTNTLAYFFGATKREKNVFDIERKSLIFVDNLIVGPLG